MTAAEEEATKKQFEDAIKASLGHVLPDDATVTVLSLKDGAVEYEIIYESTDSDAGATSIEDSLSNESVLNEITSSVATASSSTTVTTSGKRSNWMWS